MVLRVFVYLGSNALENRIADVNVNDIVFIYELDNLCVSLICNYHVVLKILTASLTLPVKQFLL